MGMSGVSGTFHSVAEINVTPLIDVLLVLLIIFMVIVPVTPRGLGTLIPQSTASAEVEPAPEQSLIIDLRGGSSTSYRIGDETLTLATLQARLQVLLAPRTQKTIFVRANKDLPYGQVVEVVERGRLAGASQIGMLDPTTGNAATEQAPTAPGGAPSHSH